MLSPKPVYVVPCEVMNAYGMATARIIATLDLWASFADHKDVPCEENIRSAKELLDQVEAAYQLLLKNRQVSLNYGE